MQSESKPMGRIRLALKCLTQPDFAQALWQKWQQPASKPLQAADQQGALQLLALLQKEGRLVDFLKEDITAYSDSQVGAAARVLHQGLNKVLKEHFELQRVMQEAENTQVQVGPGFDPRQIQLIGNLRGEPPFKGTLVHAGWQVSRVKLAQLVEGHDLKVIQPAEVEL